MKKYISVMLALVLAIGLGGCSNGVSQEEHDRVLKLNEQLQKQISELQNANVEKSVDDAAVAIIGDLLSEQYACETAGNEFLQYSIQIETTDEAIKKGYEDALFQLQVLKGLLEQNAESGAGKALSAYSAFYIKAVDEDGATVFELSYHPSQKVVSDISIGAKYLEQASSAILGK